ncbi:MAG: TonB family protein [Bacteroidota bacterium]
MKSKNEPMENLDAYLETLEKKERADKRKKLLMGGMILAFLGIGFVVFQRTILQPEEVNPPYAHQEEISVPAVPVSDLNEESESALAASSEFDFEMVEEEDDLPALLPVMTVKIQGTKKVGQELIYTIDNHNSDHQLSLDFGNGIRRKARKTNRYTYPLPGYFDMRLLIQDADTFRVLHTLNYQILPAEEEENETQAQSNSRFVDIPITRSMDPSKKTEIERPSSDDVLILDHSKNTTTKNPVVMADKMPHFPGGNAALNAYIKKHVRYPEKAPIGRKGQVVVQVVVNADGSLSNLLLLKGLGEGFDEEAIRLVAQMPRWIPGKEKGLNVPVYHKVVIPFRQSS